MVMWEPPNFEKLPNIREDDVLGQEMEAKLASLRATLLHKTRQEYDYFYCSITIVLGTPVLDTFPFHFGVKGYPVFRGLLGSLV